MARRSGTEPMTNEVEKAPLIWVNILMFALTFLACVTIVPWYGITHGYSVAAWVSFAVFLAFCGFSITGGYHRLWSHKTYEAHWSVRLFFMLGGTMALQNSILVWSSGHRIHHRYVDDNERDPYSAGRGFWFSHIGWMLREYKSGIPDFSNVRDLEQDPIVAFQHRWYLPLVLVMNIGLPMFVGWLVGDLWGVFLLGGVLRLVANHHFTFFINSLAHWWGTQPYTDENSARDNPVLAFLTYGEGYHNFHHIFTHDYRNAVRWWQWDPTKWIISTLASVGLATRLKRVPDFVIQRARLAMQFKRLERSLDERRVALPRFDLDRLRQQCSDEYQSFLATVAEWSRLREEWVSRTRASLAQKRESLAQRFEESDFKRESRQIVARLRMQQRRLQQLGAQLA
jgi:stearoyl-CoA desaturase (delta-9 desaturase)